jgi:3-hydroxyisobutyrate dehydrogenase
MGWHMAANLAKSGLRPAAFDIDAGLTDSFSREFGTVRPKALADLAGSSILFTMVPTGPVVRQVLTEGGERSLLNTLNKGAVVIDTTSSVPSGTIALGAELAKKSIVLVDCPVSGGKPGARDRSLVFMLGCDDDAAVERIRPVLSLLGKQIFRTGSLGTGHAMKSMNNYVSAACYLASCEALIVGREYGLDPSTMLDILNISTGRNFSIETSMRRIVNGTFDDTFKLGLFTKDIKIAAEMADAKKIDAPVSRLVYERFEAARAVMGGDGGHTTAYKFWEKQKKV